MIRAVRVLLVLLAAATVSGCGDPALWTRWQAERARWRADREIRRILLNPTLASVRDFQRAERDLELVGRIAPIERWTSPSRPGDPGVARQVAVISGRALVRRAELDLMRARRPEGILALANAFERTRMLPEVARAAAYRSAQALDQAGREGEALAWWIRLAREFEPYDAATGLPVTEVLEGASQAARRLERGAPAPDGVTPRTLLAGVEQRLATALDHPAPGTEPPSELAWRALGAIRTEMGDAEGAMRALRAALPSARTDDARAMLVLDLGRAALAAQWPDSARAYARWAGASGGEIRMEALHVIARSWEIAARPDSAIDAWSRLIEEYPKAQDSAAESRFRRGLLLEGIGRWEGARSEYRALAATFPSHPYSFDAQLRIVQHHVRTGEPDLARSEAEHLVEAMDYLIATQHDDAVQRAARRTRGEALLAIGDHARAFAAFADVWRRWPSTTTGVEAAWKAADVAAGPLSDRAASDSLLAEIASDAPSPEERLKARERLRHLAN